MSLPVESLNEAVAGLPSVPARGAGSLEGNMPPLLGSSRLDLSSSVSQTPSDRIKFSHLKSRCKRTMDLAARATILGQSSWVMTRPL